MEMCKGLLIFLIYVSGVRVSKEAPARNGKQIILIPTSRVVPIPAAVYYRSPYQQVRGPFDFIGNWIGNWIQQQSWIPIQLNVPDLISGFGNGLQAGVSNLVQAGVQNVGNNIANGISDRFPLIGSLITNSSQTNSDDDDDDDDFFRYGSKVFVMVPIQKKGVTKYKPTLMDSKLFVNKLEHMPNYP